MDGFDGLVVIDPDGPDLGIQIRQAQVVVVRVLVGLNDLNGQPKMRLIINCDLLFTPALSIMFSSCVSC